MTDYFPLAEGLVRVYDWDGKAGAGSMTETVLSVARSPHGATARLRRRFEAPGVARDFDFEATADRHGVRTSAWGLEFPLPAAPGARWRRDDGEWRVESLDGKADVPAGAFKGCLRVARRADEGAEERLYAPGLGLVYAVSTDESDPYALRLSKATRRDPPAA